MTPLIHNSYEDAVLPVSYDILLLNIRGFTSDKSNFFSVNYNEHDINFYCITETWANADNIDQMTVEGYSLRTFYCRETCRHGGVSIYAKHGIECNIVDVNRFCVDRHFEVCCVGWHGENNTYLHIFACYRSPSGDFDIFLTNLNVMLETFYKPSCRIVMTGDFNTNSLSANQNQSLLSLLSTFNLKNLVNVPTRIGSTSATILDLVFTNLNDCNEPMVESNTISDHETILFSTGLSNDTLRKKYKYYYYRKYDQNSINRFVSDLQHEPWKEVCGKSDFNEQFRFFYETFRWHFNSCFPLKLSNSSNSSKKSWVTGEVRDSSRRLKSLHCQRRLDPNLDH